jgi:hypothetical protein
MGGKQILINEPFPKFQKGNCSRKSHDKTKTIWIIKSKLPQKNEK